MITYQLTNINHQIYNERFGIHTFSEFVIVYPYLCGFIQYRTNQLSMELICGQLLQKEFLCKREVQFNHDTKHETLIVKMCFWEVQKGVNWRKFKNEKQNNKGAYHNCGTKSHFIKELSEEETKLEEQIQMLFISNCNDHQNNKVCRVS